MHFLIAPNSFKHSLDADDAANAIKQGLEESSLDCTTECFPVGDGGDGTGDILIKRFNGSVIETDAKDPLGRKIKTSFGLIDSGRTAIIEMANASGLRLLKKDELDPLIASSYGTGEQMIKALQAGAKKIILGMGGSATVDGGTGILRAFGIRFLDESGNELKGIPGTLNQLASIDTSNIDQRIFDCELIILCDVSNPLLGQEGAAAVFGPQKGASKQAVEQLELALTRFSQISFQQTGKDIASIRFSGTAGGAAAGLYAFLNAKLVNGIDYFLELTEFEKALQKARVVITGEGSIDEQTLGGKAPYGVAAKAKEKNLPVIGVAGKVPLEQNKNLQTYFDVLMAIGQGPSDLPEALKNTRENLVRAGYNIGNMLYMTNHK